MDYTFNQYLDEKIEKKDGIHIISIGPGCNESDNRYESYTLCFEQLFGIIAVILSTNIKEFDLVLIDPVLPNITDKDKISKILHYLSSYYLLSNYKIVENKKRIKCYICHKDIQNFILINIYLFNESLPVSRKMIIEDDTPNDNWCNKLETLIELKKDNYGCVIVQNFVRYKLNKDSLPRHEEILNLIWLVLFHRVFNRESNSNYKILLRWTGYFVDDRGLPPFYLFERFMYLENLEQNTHDFIHSLKTVTRLDNTNQKLIFSKSLDNIFIPYTYNFVGYGDYLPDNKHRDGDPPADNRSFLLDHIHNLFERMNITIDIDSFLNKFKTYNINDEGKLTLVNLFDNLDISSTYTEIVKCNKIPDYIKDSEDYPEVP